MSKKDGIYTKVDAKKLSSSDELPLDQSEPVEPKEFPYEGDLHKRYGWYPFLYESELGNNLGYFFDPFTDENTPTMYSLAQEFDGGGGGGLGGGSGGSTPVLTLAEDDSPTIARCFSSNPDIQDDPEQVAFCDSVLSPCQFMRHVLSNMWTKFILNPSPTTADAHAAATLLGQAFGPLCQNSTFTITESGGTPCRFIGPFFCGSGVGCCAGCSLPDPFCGLSHDPVPVLRIPLSGFSCSSSEMANNAIGLAAFNAEVQSALDNCCNPATPCDLRLEDDGSPYFSD